MNADASIYITNVVPWRPPQNRDPSPIEIDMMLPFLRRHIALAKPEIIVAMGNISCQALLGKRGVTKLRGQWATGCGVDVMPMFHPCIFVAQSFGQTRSMAGFASRSKEDQINPCHELMKAKNSLQRVSPF
jgi:DNA polymerase